MKYLDFLFYGYQLPIGAVVVSQELDKAEAHAWLDQPDVINVCSPALGTVETPEERLERISRIVVLPGDEILLSNSYDEAGLPALSEEQYWEKDGEGNYVRKHRHCLFKIYASLEEAMKDVKK